LTAAASKTSIPSTPLIRDDEPAHPEDQLAVQSNERALPLASCSPPSFVGTLPPELFYHFAEHSPSSTLATPCLVSAGAVTWIYNEFSCLARVRIRKAKVPGSKGWEMVAVKGKKEVKKDGGEEGEDGKGIDGSNQREKNSSRAKGKREKKKRKEIRRAHLISPISSLPSHPPDSAYAAYSNLHTFALALARKMLILLIMNRYPASPTVSLQPSSCSIASFSTIPPTVMQSGAKGTVRRGQYSFFFSLDRRVRMFWMDDLAMSTGGRGEGREGS
jgi:hypothetical protein